MTALGRFYLADVLSHTLEHCANDDGIAMECADAIMERPEEDGCQIVRGGLPVEVDPDERARLIEHAHDEHDQGMREAAAFLYGRAAVAEFGPAKKALWDAAVEIEKMAKEGRQALRALVSEDAARQVPEGSGA